MKKYLVLLLLYHQMAFGQSEVAVGADSIVWDTSYKLTWKDFQGKPAPTYKQQAAGCASSIYVDGFNDGLPNFLVTNSFLKQEAWTLDTSSDVLLAHEQLHFDIAEICARKIRFSVDSLRKKKIKDIALYSTIITEILDERNQMDEQYDGETSHGLALLRQQQWRKKVDKLLHQYRNFQMKLPS